MDLKWPKMAQNGSKWAKMGLKWPKIGQNRPKMGLKWVNDPQWACWWACESGAIMGLLTIFGPFVGRFLCLPFFLTENPETPKK